MFFRVLKPRKGTGLNGFSVALIGGPIHVFAGKRYTNSMWFENA
jgi:hypothetical protein